MAVTPCSWLFPVGQRHQFVEDFLQPLESAFVIRCAGWLFAVSQVLAVRFPDLRNFFPQLCDALLDGPWQGDRLAEHILRDYCFSLDGVNQRGVL